MFRSIINWFRVLLRFATKRQIQIETIAMSCESLEEREKLLNFFDLQIGEVAQKASPNFSLAPLIYEQENLEIIHYKDRLGHRQATQIPLITMIYSNGDKIKFPSSRQSDILSGLIRQNSTILWTP